MEYEFYGLAFHMWRREPNQEHVGNALNRCKLVKYVLKFKVIDSLNFLFYKKFKTQQASGKNLTKWKGQQKIVSRFIFLICFNFPSRISQSFHNKFILD